MGTVTNYLKLLPISIFCCLFLWACSSGGNEEPEIEQKSEIKIDASIISNGIEFSCAGGEQSISFTCTESWTLRVSDDTWCSASAIDGSKGYVTVKFLVTANDSYSSRNVSVTIKSGSASKTFQIKQEGKEADKIEIEKTSFDIATKGDSISLSFNTNMDWTASSNVDWCILDKTNGEKGKNNIDITINANEVGEDRTGTITIKAGNATKEVIIQQYRKESIVLDKSIYEIDASGGNLEVKVDANTKYEVNISNNWITSSKQNDDKITFSIEKNEDEQPREAIVKLQGKYMEGAFTIRQSGKNVKVEGSGSGFIKG